eukprot:TRINITY_DN14281_c1_g1_i2.p1 TRINITY_DN14281_c1_g1~~TRINITY_DN14281_c1_g1_i2.p1  ORF type:complete len:786 (+),score=105.69 TRINITY_DN14281_c1_g1_i2:83-2440(+)
MMFQLQGHTDVPIASGCSCRSDGSSTNRWLLHRRGRRRRNPHGCGHVAVMVSFTRLISFFSASWASMLSCIVSDVRSVCDAVTVTDLNSWRGAEAMVPNYDCLDNPIAEDAFQMLLTFEGSLSLFRSTGSVRSSGWEGAEREYEVWNSYAEFFLGFRDRGALSTDEALIIECPFGLFALQVARWIACLIAGPQAAGGRCADHRVDFSRVFVHKHMSAGKVLPVMQNTRWMPVVCTAMQLVDEEVKKRAKYLDPAGVVPGLFDCFHVKGDAVDWERFHAELVSASGDGSDAGIYKFVFGRRAGKSLQDLRECVLGTLAVALEKLHIAQILMTQDYPAFAAGVTLALADIDEYFLSNPETQLRDSLSVLALTRWPILTKLCTCSYVGQAKRSRVDFGYQHKPYDLEFRPEEIIRPPEERAELVEVRALPPSEHIERLRWARGNRISPTFRAVLGALVTALHIGISDPSATSAEGGHAAAAIKVVFFTMIWGSRLAGYLRGSIDRMAAFGHVQRYIVFCLDDPACQTCEQAHPFATNCVAGRLKTIFNKFTMLSVIVGSGVDCIYLDFDTLLLKDPLPAILRAAVSNELLVSRDFGSFCLNTGVIYMKAHPDTADFLASLITWLWHHPYEFSQKAFSGFLGVENITSEAMEGRLFARMPRWNTLDPMNAFVTSIVYHKHVEGWTGRLEEIVIYHFLDGTGGVDESTAVEGRYVNLYDLFYANPTLNLSDIKEPLWLQDPRVEHALLKAHHQDPPAEVQRCSLWASREQQEREAELHEQERLSRAVDGA